MSSSVTFNLVHNNGSMYLLGRLGDMYERFLIDTGATTSLIPSSLVSLAGLNRCMDYTESYRRLHASLSCRDVNGLDTILHPYFVVMDSAPPILGLDILRAHKAKLTFPPDPRLTLNNEHVDTKIERPIRVMCGLGQYKDLAILDTGACKLVRPT